MPTDTVPRAAFGYRDFRLFQLGRLCGVVGFQMQGVAVGWQVYALTHQPLSLGLVGLAQFLPVFGLTLVTGHVADRFDRRAVLVACWLLLAACSAALLGLALATPHVWAIYGVLAVIGTARAFSSPAGSALMPNLIPLEHFPSAVAWSSSIFQVATIAGPAVGGVVYAAGGPAAVYGASTALELATVLSFVAIRTRSRGQITGASTWARLAAGIRYVRDKKLILGAISLDLFAVLFGGAVALLPVYARDILHVGPSGLGALRSAPAVGAALVAVSLAWRPLKRHAGVTMLVCVGLFGAGTIVFGLSRSFLLSLAALFVVGASDMISVFVRQTLVQLATPDEMRGRVSAVSMVFIVGSNELGEFESGVTAAWLGAVPAVIAGGVGTIVVVLLWSALFPVLRKVDRLDEGLGVARD